jgi:hypothetical protein
MSCSESPLFVIVKKTPTGYSFDNNVIYKSPFATHTLTQETGMLHPSLIVKSNWGLDRNKSIISMITGESGAKVLNSKTNRDIVINKSIKGVVASKIGLLKNRRTGGYTLARFNRSGTGNAPSVAELANVLNSLSKTPGNIKVRGSPLEYKRLLDYIQFIMSRKVSSDNQLYLARPNNVHLMDDIRDGTSTLEDVYMDVFNAEDNNSKMYNRSYFVTYDRVAALASVIRDIPTLYQVGFSKNNPFSQSFFLIESSNNIRKLQNIIKDDIVNTSGFTLYNTYKGPSVNGHSNRKQVLLYNNKPVVTTGPLFEWFLDLRNVTSKTQNGKTRIVGSDFHKLSPENKAKILFYWAFNYPKPGIGGGQGNATVIEYFLSILDTFHDFTGNRATKVFRSIWPEASNKTPHNKAKTKTRNSIKNSNIPSTNIGHKFLVDLLGIDIYRKAQKRQYGNNIVSTLKKSNSRGINSQMKVAHFLFFITNIFGSQSSRQLINACEQYAKNIMVKLAQNTPITPSKLCEKLETSGSCIVVDAITGSLPECMSKYSVYHNVGILDPATKGVLSWGQVTGDGECIESAKEKARKKRKQKELQRKLRASKAKEERVAKARATRNKTKRLELIEKQRLEKLRKNKLNMQKLGRNQRLAARRKSVVNQSIANKPKTPNTKRPRNTQNNQRSRTPNANKPRNTQNNQRSRTPNAKPLTQNQKSPGINMFGMRREPNLPQGNLNMFGTRRQSLKTNYSYKPNGSK